MNPLATNRGRPILALVLTVSALLVTAGAIVGAYGVVHAAPAPLALRHDPDLATPSSPAALRPALLSGLYAPQQGIQGDPTRYVAPTGNDSGSCTNPAAPCRTVQYAVNQATAGDEVLIATGVYTPGGQGQVVLLNKSVTLRGGYTTADWQTFDPVANPTILDGGGTARVIRITGGVSPVVEGLHLRAGHADYGGGVLIEAGSPVLQRNRLYNNMAILNGGGVYIAGGEPVLENNLFYGNVAAVGRGGGLYVAGGAPLLQHNTLYGNEADERGGGVYLAAGTPRIGATIIVSNTAGQGGGVYGGGGSPLLDYNDVWANVGGDYGGSVSAGSHSTSTNPLFVDAMAADFHLQADSPCRDWVPITQTVAVDFEGLARPFGPQADIGAYEFYTGTCFARVEAGQVYTTVQAAVDAAEVGTTVKVAGFCTGSGSAPVVFLNQALTLRGGYTLTNWSEADPVAHPTILDGGGSRRVVHIGPVAAVVEGLHIRRGYLTSSSLSPVGGAGVYISGGSPLVRYNFIYSNTIQGDAGSGAGLYAAAGQPTIRDNEIYANTINGQDGKGGGLCLVNSLPLVEENRVHHNLIQGGGEYGGGGLYLAVSDGTIQDNEIYGNQAYVGGGVSFRNSGPLTFRQNDVYGNTAQTKGGGMLIYSSRPVVEGNRFFGNQTANAGPDYGGGGIYLYYDACSPLVRQNELYNNQALGNGNQGGGIHIYVWGNSQPVIDRNAVYQNSAAGNGGGLLVRAASSGVWVTVRNNLIYNNSANGNGGGLSLRENPSLLENNTLYGNQAATGGGIYVLSGAGYLLRNNILVNNATYGLYSVPALSDSYSNVWGNGGGNYGGGAAAGTGSISQNPLFVAPPADLRLQAGSPCIDQADPAQYPPEDYAGWVRPFGPRADMGAYEFYTGACFARVGASQVYTSPQAAVDVATSGDVVQVAGRCQGVHSRTVGSQTFFQTVYISQPLTLRGGYTLTNWLTPTTVTILDAQGQGRGVYLTGTGPITVDGFLIQGGAATVGGGLYLDGPVAATIQNVIFYSNTATNGGGLAGVGASSGLYNNTFAYNTATNLGGGLYLSGGTAALSNTIVVSNSAITGGGLYVTVGLNPVLAYNDFWHNSGGDYAGTGPGSTDRSVNPRFLDPAGGDLHLRLDSPCLHNADPATTLRQDLEGDPRPLGRGYDIGADESSLYPDLILAPDYQGGGLPGQVIVYHHVLTNSGTITDAYHLTHTLLTGGPPAGWGAVDYTPAFTLAPGEVTAVPVAVLVPTDAISSSHAIVVLTATSQVNPGVYDAVRDTTVVNWNPGVELAPEYHEYVNPGTVMTYVHILTNTGNAPDTFQLVWNSSRGWTTVTPTLVSNLGPHLTATVWVALAVPATMPGGEVEMTRLEVTSLVPGSNASTAITDSFTVVHTPGDRYVATWGDDTLNNCQVFTYPCSTVEYAVGQAVTGDRVKVAAGTYYEHDILLNKRITLQGGYPSHGPWGDGAFAPELHITTLDAQGKGRVLNISGDPTVEGLHLVGGSTSGSGGAVYVGSGTPRLRRNVIHGNHADRLGGGVYNALGSLTLERNLLYNNSAGLDGGGFYHALGNPAVWNNFFYNNAVGRNGGGLYTAAGTPRLWHNTFYGNQAAGYGGGLYLGNGSPTISNTIVVSNTASLGGGIYRGGGSPTLDYNDLWANGGGDYGGGLSAGPHDLSADPEFVDPGQGDYHLQETSPCVNRGVASSLAEDFDGHPRPVGPAPDIGADEYLLLGVLLEPNNVGRTAAGVPIAYRHVLTNTGIVTDTFNLTARSSRGWLISSLNPPNVKVGPGLTATVEVIIQVPTTALSGTVDTTVVTATAGLNPHPFDTAVNTTTVILTRDVILEPDHVAIIPSLPAQPRPVLFPHTLTNTGNYTDTFDLTWSSSAGLSVVVVPAQATVGPAQSVPVWVTVTVPALDPAILLVDTTHVTATSHFSPTVSDAVTDTTFVNRTVGVQFAPDRSGRGRPGDMLLYTHTLTNTGNYTDTFVLTLDGWGEVPGPTEVTLGGGDTTTVEVAVTIPALALSDTVGLSLITATSQFSPTIYDPLLWSGPVSDTVLDATLVERVIGVDLRRYLPEGEGLCVMAPGEAVYTLRIVNLGNYTDTFDISAVSEHGWPVTINPNPVTVGPWRRSNVMVVVSVPPIAEKTQDLLLVTATSRADPAVSDSTTYVTMVNWDVEAELAPDHYRLVVLESSVVYTHLLTNTGEVTNSFHLGGWSGHGWEVNVVPEQVDDLPPGGSVPVTATVYISPGVIYADDMTIISATALYYCPATAYAFDYTTVTRPHVTLYPDHQGQAGPGTTITYTHWVSNSGAVTDSYDLTADNSLGWPLQVTPTTISNLPPGARAAVQVRVGVPAGVQPGTLNTTVVTATSHYTVTIFDTAVDTTTVPHLPGALLEPACYRQADPGDTVVCTHTLQNTGNYTETFYLVTHGEFAYAEVEPAMVGPLAPGEVYSPVLITIWLPSYAASGQTEHTEVIITFATAPGQASAVETTYVNFVNGTRYVAPTGLDAYNNCLDLNYGPCATVQRAIWQALPPDLIKVATGIYTDLHTFGGDNQVVYLTETLTLRGGYSVDDWETFDPEGQPTTLNAGGQGRVVVIAAAGISPTVEGFHLTGGSGESGGGVYIASAAFPTLRLNTIYSNTADSGGGIYFGGGGNPLLERNTLYNNLAQNGGGFYLHSGSSTVWNNVVYDNQAGGKGGGLYTLSGNPTVLNNTFYSNDAGDSGGGIYIAVGAPLIGQTIVANNTGYGLYNGSGSPLLAYNDLWGNSGGDSNLPPGPGSFAADPRFANAVRRDLHLSGASPCIDAGDPAATQPGDDRDGNSRPLGLRYDVGAYEYNLAKAKGAPAMADPGAIITYTLVLSNVGAVPQPGVIVTDLLHPYLSYGGMLAYNHGYGEYLTASRTISWTGPVYPDAPTLITFTARITSWLAAGTPVTNVAWVDLARSNVVTTTVAPVAGTRHVAVGGEDLHNNCLLDWKPCATVQYGVDQALAGDQVKVAGGVYTDSVGSGCVVSVTRALMLTGGFAVGEWAERDPVVNPTVLDGQGVGRGVCIAGAEEVHLTGFWVTGSVGAGVEAVGTEVELVGNQVYGNGGAGVHLEGGLGYRLVNNIVARNGDGGLRVVGGAGELVHNTFAENGPVGVAMGGTAVLTNTLFYSHSVALEVGGGGWAALWHTLWHANLTDTVGAVVSSTNLYGDPAFIAPAAADYHIRSHSAALDAGLDVGVDEDVDTGPRPLLAAPDIGADEYPLAVTKQVQPVANPGQIITYTIEIQGEEEALLITDTLHPYLDYGGMVDCSAGSCSYLAARRAITWTGGVASPPPVVITFTARITGWLAAGTPVTNQVEGLVSNDHFRTGPVVTVVAPVAGTRHVAVGGEDLHNNCLLDWKPCATVQYGVDQALAGDQVKVAGGVYTDSVGSGCVVSVTRALMLTGGFAVGEWAERDPVVNPTVLDGQGVGRGVCIAGAEEVHLTGFWVTGSVGAGVEAVGTEVELVGNQVYGNGGAGVHLEGGLGYRLVNNIVARNGDGGLRVVGGAGELVHNTFAENGPVGVAMGGTAVLTNTLFYSHSVALEVGGGGWAALWHTLWHANLTDTVGAVVSSTNLYGDPAFIAPAAADYHLQGDSPALNAGLWVGVDEDIDRDGRPDGQAPDLGADQYPLRVSRWVQPTAALPCGVVTHTLSLTSLDNAPLTGVQLRDPLPAGVGFAGWLDCSSGTCSYVPGAITWLGPVDSSAPTLIHYTAVLSPYLISGTNLVHIAIITDSLSTFHSPPVTVTAQTTDAALVKVAPAQATIGQVVTYTILYTVPAGHVAYQPLMSDRLPTPALTYVPGSGNPPPAQVAPDGSIITWTLTTVSATCGAPQVVAVTFAAQVQNLPDSGRGDVLTNTVALSYTEAAGGPAHQVAAVQALTLVEPEVTLDKQMAPDTDLGLLDLVAITLTVNNTGNSPLYDLVLSDTLPAGLDLVAATPGYQASGQTVTWTLPSLAFNAAAVYTLTVQVSDTVEPGAVLFNRATVEGSSLPGIWPAERAYTATAQAAATVGYPDLVVAKERGPAVCSPGQVVTYTILYTNVGVLPAVQVRLVDTLPPLLTDVISATSGPATVERAGQVVTWTLPGPLGPEAGGAIWITGTVLLTAPDGGVLLNTVSITTTTPEQNLENNTAWVTSTVRRPALHIGKVATPDVVMPGGQLEYTLTVQNEGLGVATGLIISDAVPLHTTYLSCSGGDSCSLEGSTVVWNVASLPPGASIQVTFAVQVSPDTQFGMTVDNQVYRVACEQGETAIGQPVSTPIGLLGNISLEPDRSGAGWPGQQVVYTHTLTNNSNVTQAINLSVASSQGWAVSVSPTVVNLAAGASAPVTVTLLVGSGATAGTVDTTVVTAIGALIGQDTATDTTTIVGHFIYLPMILRQY